MELASPFRLDLNDLKTTRLAECPGSDADPGGGHEVSMRGARHGAHSNLSMTIMGNEDEAV
jgi:hypothetical protein